MNNFLAVAEHAVLMLVCNVLTCSYKASQQLPHAPGIDLLLFTLNIYPMRGRLQLLQIAVLLYRNLAIKQLNCQVMLCHWVVSWISLPAQRPLSWKTPSLSMWTTRSNHISLTSWQRFSSCTEQQKPVSTSYGLKMVHKFAPNTQ